MLQLRPSCECCDRALPPESTDARICSFECTFCIACAESVLHGVCPNCGGELVARPRHPVNKLAASPPDIAERKEIEEALRESELRWTFALQGSGDGVWDWNYPEGTAFFSTRWKAMLGHAEDEIGTSAEEWSKRVHPNDLPGVLAALQAHIDGKTTSVHIEHRLLCKDGSWMWVTGRGMVVSRDDEGNPLRIVGTNTDITERKRIEHEMEQYQTLFQLSTEAKCIVDPFGCFKRVNEAFVNMLGYSEAELLSKPFIEFIVPEDRPSTADIAHLLVGGQRVVGFENRYIRKDGSLTYLSWMSYFHKEDGVVYSSARNVTEQKRAEEVLKESEFLLRESQQIASIGSYKLDVMSGLWKSSEELDKIFGIDKDYSRNVQGWQELAHPQDAEMMSQYLSEEVLGKRKPFNKEYRIVRKSDGETRWVNGLGGLEFDPEGNIVSMIGTIQDITERKRGEESLHESWARFERMAETVPAVLYDYMLYPDGSNRFTYMNHRSKEILGVDAEEIIADSNKFWSLVHDDDRHRLREEDVRANKVGTGLIAEHRIVTPKGELKWLHVESKPSPVAPGEPATWSGFILDITERKAAQESIEHLAQHDILTGLANRALFSDRLENALSSASRDRCRFALMSIDLDMFKPVNDQFGHPVGDLLLKEVAQRMVVCVRDSDTVARTGGDEFVVLLRNVAGEHEALAVAEKIRASLEQPFVASGHTLLISCCVGLALYPQHGQDDETLSRHADHAMYQAKDGGRNRVRLYEQQKA